MGKPYSDTEKRRCVRRELSFRRKVYPGWVERKKMSQEDADREIAVMEAIEADYDRLIAANAKPPAQRGLSLAPIDIQGPFPLGGDAALRACVLARLREAQEVGELPPRHSLPPDEAAVIWIGEAPDPDAFAVFYETYPKVAWLDLLYVRPHARAKGYGSLLLQAFEQLLRSERFSCAELGTMLDNAVMHRVAGRLGWEKSGLVMERKLSGSNG